MIKSEHIGKMFAFVFSNALICTNLEKKVQENMMLCDSVVNI